MVSLDDTSSNSNAIEVSLDLEINSFRLLADFQAKAEVIVLFGPSGSGKSTILRTIAGLVTPNHGVIRLGNLILFDADKGINLSPMDRRVGYVPQNYALFPHLTVAENVAYGLHRLGTSQRKNRVKQLLTLMRIQELSNRRPENLSGGQQQRVALARALAPQPAILLMDEPLAALDESLRQALRVEIKNIPDRFKIPLLLVTHHLGEAYSLAGQLAVLQDGEMHQVGSRDEVFRHPATPTVARIMGMNNILTVELVDHTYDHGVKVRWNGLPLTIPSAPDGVRDFQVGIRPEEILIVRDKRPRSPRLGENILPVRIIDDVDMGLDHRMTVAVDTQLEEEPTLEIRISHPIFLRLKLAVGQKRSIAIPSSTIHVFHPSKVTKATPRK
jgi:molybdate transport system ATP-binding protein